MKTKLINYRTYNLDKSKVTPIDRRSVFGNIFTFAMGSRNEIIEKYKIYFYKRLKKDAKFREEVLKLKDKTLGCWCTPLPCHGDVIIEYLNSLETEGLG